MPFRLLLVAVTAAVAVMTSCLRADADDRKPTAKEVAAIRGCLDKYKNDDTEAERRCLFKVAEPCLKSADGQSTVGMAECYRVETAIWDDLLNDNFKGLRDELDDDDQKAKLREMQRAWIASRDATCAFYHHKIRGTMAIPMSAACVARETARRALLLAAFEGL